MACARGCCETPAEHWRSIAVAKPGRESMSKVTTDDHGTHTVDVIEHFDGRQDVTVHAPTYKVRSPRINQES